MSAITKAVTPSVSSLTDQNDTIPGYNVGEDIAAGDACYIASTGLIMRCDGSASDGVKNRVMGFAAKAAKVAQKAPLTLYTRATFAYGASLTPGTWVYLSGSVKGGLDTASSTNVTGPCGYVIDAQQIRLFSSHY